jgi:Ca2+-transporting ATPase
MERSPRSAGGGIITGVNQLQIVWQGGLLTVASLAVFVWGLTVGHDVDLARTMLFTTMTLSQLLHSLNYRLPDTTIWSREALANRWLILAFFVSLGAQLLIIYLPFLQRVFHTVALGPGNWAAVVLAAALPVAIIDAIKVALARRRARSSGNR